MSFGPSSSFAKWTISLDYVHGLPFSSILFLIWVSLWMQSVVENPLQKPAYSLSWLESSVSMCHDFCEQFVDRITNRRLIDP